MSEGPIDAPAYDRAAWRPRANPWLIALCVTSASFMEVLDTTIVNVALPHIAGSLSAGTDEATWTLTSYLVANGIVLPISGWLGSVFGRKRYFLICIGMFTLCSLLCGLSTSLSQLIIFRVLQGFFGGGLQPNQQSIVLDTFPPHQRTAAFSVTAMTTIIAPVLGPTLGGLITDNFNWRWIFFINVPIGIAALIAIYNLVDDPPWAKASKGKLSIDYIGLGLIALGLGSLELVLDRGQQEDWLQSSFIRAFAVLAVIGLTGAVCWLLIAKKPVVNIRVLKNRHFALGAGMIFAMAVVLYSGAVLIPQLAQQQLGYDATLAGLLLSPGAALTVVCIPIVSRLLPRVQTRFLVMVGFIILTLSLFHAASLPANPDFLTLASVRAFQTFGLAFLFVPISTLAFGNLPAEMNRDAASLYTMFRNVAGSVGIAVSTALVTQYGQRDMSYMAEHLSPLNPAFTAASATLHESLTRLGVAPSRIGVVTDGYMYRELLRQSAIRAYLDVFRACALMALCIVPLTLLFRPTKPGGKPSAGVVE